MLTRAAMAMRSVAARAARPPHPALVAMADA